MCLELFLHASFYATHPILNKIYAEDQHQGETVPFSSFNNVFDLSFTLKEDEYPYGSSLTKIVQCEAIKTSGV